MAITPSKDGTRIAYDKTGQGPALILVAGAFQDRMAMGAYARPLSEHFTIYNYDRRGRGESGDIQPYAIQREIEDIDALVQEAGGSAYVFGGSSGGVLTLDAAAHGLNITKLAVYEPPFVVDDSREPPPENILDQLKGLDCLRPERRCRRDFHDQGLSDARGHGCWHADATFLAECGSSSPHSGVRRNDHGGHHARQSVTGGPLAGCQDIDPRHLWRRGPCMVT